MVHHQTEADESHGHASTCLPEQTDEAVVVLFIVEDPCPAIAAIQGMVTIPTNGRSRCSRHGHDCCATKAVEQE